jgi:hypothetical protein
MSFQKKITGPLGQVSRRTLPVRKTAIAGALQQAPSTFGPGFQQPIDQSSVGRARSPRQEIRMEKRKFVQIVLALVAALGVGVAIGRFWLFDA